MIPFVIKSLYFSDIDLKYPPTEARLYSLISASWTWDSYCYKYYLYNCLVYGINPRSEIFKVNKRWWFFNSEIPTGVQ